MKRSIFCMLAVLVMVFTLTMASAETIVAPDSVGSTNGQTIVEMLNNGQVPYVTVPSGTEVYKEISLEGDSFVLEDADILPLAVTEYNREGVRVWLIDEAKNVVSGYVHISAIEAVLTADEAKTLAGTERLVDVNSNTDANFLYMADNVATELRSAASNGGLLKAGSDPLLVSDAKLYCASRQLDYLRNTDGSRTTTVRRHYVKINGTQYNAFCLNSGNATYEESSARIGTVRQSTGTNKEAGIWYIMNNCGNWETDNSDYVIAQWALWRYLGADWNCRVNNPSSLKSNGGMKYTTSQMRTKINDLVSAATAFAKNPVYPDGGTVPSLTITGNTMTWDSATGKYTGTVTIQSNGSQIKIDRSSITAGASLSASWKSSDTKNYYLNSGTTTVTVASTTNRVNFNVTAANTATPVNKVYIATPNSRPDYYQAMGFYKSVSASPDEYTKSARAELVGEITKASIQIVKVDAEDNVTPLAGAVFELRDASGDVVRTGTTDADGALVFNNLEAGDYTVVEITPPTDYLTND